MRAMYDYYSARFNITSPDEGATAVEYGIMVALIAIVIIIAVTLLGETLRQVFFDVEESLGGVGGGTAGD